MPKSSFPACDAGGTGLGRWLEDRLGVSQWVALARKKSVPLHRHSFWYYWGGIALFLFLMQAVTGLLLLVYYRPGAEAYESVRQITYEVDFGWLIRSTHSWAANLMVAAIFVHMFSAFFMKAYRSPREVTWWTGLALLGLTLVFGFSGYLLPMDELSYFATKVGLEIPAKIPVIGEPLVNLVRGGLEINATTTQRFFALHAAVLPIVFAGFLALHLWLVQRHGNAVPPSEEAKPEALRRSIPFFPNFFMKDLAMWLIALNVLTIMATLFPWGLGPQADPLSPAPEGIHPEWYFMSQFQALKALGEWLPGGRFGSLGEMAGIALFTLGGVVWALIPLWDRDRRFGRRARSANWLGLVFLIGLIALTIWGYMVL